MYAAPRLRSRTIDSGRSGCAARVCQSDEGGQQHDGAGEHPPGQRGVPAVGLGVREAVDEAEERAGDEQGARDVELRPRAGAGDARDEDQGADEGDGGDEDVDVEVPAPVERLGQDAAEEQPDGPAGAGDRTEDAEGAGALLGTVKVVVSTASAVGASSAPNAPCSARAADEQLERAGGAAERRGDGEADEADDEGALAAHQVGEAAAEQEQAGEGERVGGDDPLALAVGEAEVGLGRGERDVHDGARRGRP